MTKRTEIASILLVLVGLSLSSLTSCQRSVPPVPPSGRTVVQPKGSTEIMKSWNRTTRAEGDAILGPLSNERR